MPTMPAEYNRIRQREWRARLLLDPEKHEQLKAKKRAQSQANPKKRSKEKNQSYAKNLTNAYVAMTMEIPVKDAPPELLEVKRKIIQLTRTLKGTTNHDPS
jgi:TPP-dependent 2-oxoacid decarboxylase